jgi:hypothetical protein
MLVWERLEHVNCSVPEWSKVMYCCVCCNWFESVREGYCHGYLNVVSVTAYNMIVLSRVYCVSGSPPLLHTLVTNWMYCKYVEDPCGYICSITEHREHKRNGYDLNIVEEPGKDYVKCQILRVLVSAFALVHFQYINCLFIYLFTRRRFPCLWMLKMSSI